MKEFLKHILFFVLTLIILLEVCIRLFSLTNDVPMRKTNSWGLQIFKENQSGFSHGFSWNVNKDGFLGHNDKNGENQLLLIGDSFIENIMNPFSCRQSTLFSKSGYSVFEVGRSGITFIESLEFLKYYDSTVNPKKTIIFLDNSDFRESIVEIKKLNDRGQISLIDKKLFSGEIKGKNIKKILYNFKTLYYLYTTFLKSRNNKSQSKTNNENSKSILETKSDVELKIKELIIYGSEKYNLEKTLFVFRGENNFIDVFHELKLNYIELNIFDEQYLIPNDGHWNCRGHQIAFEKILKYLNQ